ncbi:integrase core domain-containing protein [Gilliamella apicola]|uniref:integrase core domain-containing protein n=1 Tax=Gilliamella sp. App4-10 TaxID=3120231 RepID=UPI00080E2A60|nr:hypothetical protein A9G23_03995 [Gilliamella apicola]
MRYKLGIEKFEHTKTKAYTLQPNEMYERFHKTMKIKYYNIMFKRKMYNELSETQYDIEQWLEFYNKERVHSVKYSYDKTPKQT